MSAHRWMPFYVAEYLADTTHLNTVEHGAYLLLIMHYWQHGRLPQSDDKLATIARLSEHDWQAIRSTIIELFSPDWRHKRIDHELKSAETLVKKRREAGKAGASARYSKRMANAEQTNAPIPIPIQTATQLARADYDRIEIRCREAAGLENDPSPSLIDVSPIINLMNKHYDLETDILPKLREAKLRGKRGRTWTYYVPAIEAGKAANDAIKPNGNGAPAKTPVAWINTDDPRWGPLAERWRREKGKDPPHTGGVNGSGWHFPESWIEGGAQ